MSPRFIFTLIALVLFLAPVRPAMAQLAASASGISGSTAASAAADGDSIEKKKKVGFYELALDKLKKSFFVRFVIDLASIAILIGLIYYPAYRRKDFFFTFLMFNVIVFFITYLLSQMDMSIGAAFGLFAVFSLLRYPTEDISPKDMTYLFTVIAMGLMAALNKGTFLEICIINAFIIIPAYFLESGLLFRAAASKAIQYDNIEKIKPEQYDELVADLRKRTGLDIFRVSVGRVDYLKDSANVRIYYYEKKLT